MASSGKQEKKRLKQLDLDTGRFTANGREYYIDSQLSADRFYKMQELSYDLGFGVTYEELFKNLGELYELLNAQKFADSSVMCHNLMNGIADLENREMPVLKYCACFINFEGEDTRYWNEKIAGEKINDWMEEGIEFQGFFLLSLTMVRGLRENYNNHIQSISQGT